MLIAGDVGGTKARLGIFERNGDQLELLVSERFPSKDYENLESITKHFLEQHRNVVKSPLEAACFGVPGPVVAGRVKVTNLPWEIVQSDLSASLSIPKVKLVNDLVSTAAAIPLFKRESLHEIYAGKGNVDLSATCAVVAPGTGLGHALIHRDDNTATLLASEGGHSNFAPGNELEIELLRYLLTKFPQVSNERLLSGPGLVNIYSFLRDTKRAEEHASLAVRLKEEDPASVIATTALKDEHEISVRALDMFCRILGAHASNVALNFLAVGGIYLGGGIPPKIIPAIEKGWFMDGYLQKVMCLDRIEATPVFVIKDDFASLYGAAAIARSL